jgi:hypothetical protein
MGRLVNECSSKMLSHTRAIPLAGGRIHTHACSFPFADGRTRTLPLGAGGRAEQKPSLLPRRCRCLSLRSLQAVLALGLQGDAAPKKKTNYEPRPRTQRGLPCNPALGPWGGGSGSGRASLHCFNMTTASPASARSGQRIPTVVYSDGLPAEREAGLGRWSLN